MVILHFNRNIVRGSDIGSGMQPPACFEGDFKECLPLKHTFKSRSYMLKGKCPHGKNRSIDEFGNDGFIDNGLIEFVTPNILSVP